MECVFNIFDIFFSIYDFLRTNINVSKIQVDQDYQTLLMNHNLLIDVKCLNMLRTNCWNIGFE